MDAEEGQPLLEENARLKAEVLILKQTIDALCRRVFGKSSGGYGAMVHALLHPDFWSAAAVHSGDMGFELLYRHEFVPVLRALAKQPDIGQWVDEFWQAKKAKDSDVHILMMLEQAESFDPDPSEGY